MENIKIIIDATTGDVTTQPLTEEEISARAEFLEQAAVESAEAVAREEARSAAFARARSKLAALGLTEEEIAAIIGG
jgi:hypothetical protein